MKPTEEALLEDYLKAVPALTIHYDKDKSVLEKRVAELAEKEKEETEQTKKELKKLKLQNDNNNALLRRVMKTMGELFVKSEDLDPNVLKWTIIDTADYVQDHGGDGEAYLERLLNRREEEKRKKKKNKLT